MKNYYELLEVSEKASPEVIKKAYTTLVKKYHPDLQPDSEKKKAEEKIKEINEAYEVLSDKNKRESYDNKLNLERQKKEQVKYADFSQTQSKQSTKNNYNQNIHSNINYNNYTNNYNKSYNTNNSNNSYTTQKSNQSYQKRIIRKPHKNTIANNYATFQDDYTEMMNDAYSNAYNDAFNQAYINNLKNMGYEIHYERPFKEKIQIAVSIIVVIFILSIIGLVLWQIPPIKHYLINLYNTNEGFRLIVNIIGGIFRGIINIFKR